MINSMITYATSDLFKKYGVIHWLTDNIYQMEKRVKDLRKMLTSVNKLKESNRFVRGKIEKISRPPTQNM